MGDRKESRLMLNILVQAAGVHDGVVTDMGEPVGRREVKSSVLDMLSAGCKLHFQTLESQVDRGSMSMGEGWLELFCGIFWLTDGTGPCATPLVVDGFQNSALFRF